MKLRHGFVSNSSSSSFLVAFPDDPKDEKEVRNLLFGKKKHVTMWNDPVPTEIIARNVFISIRGQEPLHLLAAAAVIKDDSPTIFKEFKAQKDKYGCWGVPPNPSEKGEVKTFFGECDVSQEEALAYLEKEFKDKTIYQFSFCDNDGEPWSTMEHGEIFKKLPCFRFNHH